MNWDAIGAIAELFGAVGVIASLAYLAVQIRQNTRSMRAATYQSLAEATAASNTLFLSNPELVRIVRVGSAGQERLSEDDFARFNSYLRMTVRRYDSIFLHYRQATLPDEAWQAYWHSFKGFLASPGVLKWWERNSHDYTEAFQELVTREIRSATAPRGDE